MPIFAVPSNCPHCLGDAFATGIDAYGGIDLHCRSCGRTVADPSYDWAAQEPEAADSPTPLPGIQPARS